MKPWLKGLVEAVILLSQAKAGSGLYLTSTGRAGASQKTELGTQSSVGSSETYCFPVQSLTEDSEREQEVAEALFDLANACGPSNDSDEQPIPPSPPGLYDHSDTASSSHGSRNGTQAYGPASGKRKVTGLPPPLKFAIGS